MRVWLSGWVRYLRRIRPDVVHCHAVLPDGMWILLAARLFGVRTKSNSNFPWLKTSYGSRDVPYGIRGSEKSKRLIRYVTQADSGACFGKQRHGPTRQLMQAHQ